MTYDELVQRAKTDGMTEEVMLRRFLVNEQPWNNDQGDLVDMFMEGFPPYKEQFKVFWEDLDDEEQEETYNSLPR